jgi:D-alanyl-D-alanine carboxypeptidase
MALWRSSGSLPHLPGIRRGVGAVAAALLVAVVATASSTAAVPERSPATDWSVLQGVLDDLVAESPSTTPGAAAAVVSPHGTWTAAAGVADLATGRPVTPADHFRLGSLTKTYTATVVLRLVAEGHLDLSDTAQQWLPGVLPPDKRQITLRQMLAHTSGLYDSINDANEAYAEDPEAFLATIDDQALRDRIVALAEQLARDPETLVDPKIWVDIAASQPLFFAPGTDSRYSSVGYVLLGWIVEKVTGASLAEAIRQYIVEPLALRNTVHDPGPTLPDPFAHGYTLDQSGEQPPVDQSRVTLGTAGGGALAATAPDAARFYAALLAGDLVPPDLLHGAMLPEGLGIGTFTTGCTVAYGHVGALGGYVSYATVSPDGETAAVLLLNGRGPATDARGASAAARLLCSALPRASG